MRIEECKIGMCVVAIPNDCYGTTTDGWRGEIVNIYGDKIAVANRYGGPYWVYPKYFNAFHVSEPKTVVTEPAVTDEEKKAILEDMKYLLGKYDYEYTSNALRKIIDTWANHKAILINAFKKHKNYIPGKFMIAFDMDYERTIDKKESAAFGRWAINATIKENLPDPIKARCLDWEVLPSMIWDFFYSLENYAERTLSDESAAYLERAIPEIHPHAGQKMSRVVNKICCYLGLDKVEGYNREFAKYADSLSPLTIKRHTVISLNPLDYLTMSFGNSWASCHTIDKENKRGMPDNYQGCYSSGTISYMLDQSSMVLYTVDAAYDGDEYWNQPKITRQMFHYGAEKLVQGRLYPKDNDGNNSAYTPYRNIVQQVISEIFEFPNRWTFTKGTEAASRHIYAEGTHYEDYTHYGNCTLSKVKGVENEGLIYVGHRPICIECGCEHDDEESINCCDDGRYYCADCGRRISDDESYWVDDDRYCRDCVSYCERCGEYHRGDSYYVEDEDRDVCEWCYDEHYAQCPHCCYTYNTANMVWVEGADNWVCENCLEDSYTRCDDCGDYIRNRDVCEYGEECTPLCSRCYDERIENEDEAV